MLLTTPTCCICWLASVNVNRYGIGGVPAPPTPPEPHEYESQARSVPSFFAPTFTRAYADGRHPAVSSSGLRSSIIFTGLPPVFFESCETATPQGSTPSLLPKP